MGDGHENYPYSGRDCREVKALKPQWPVGVFEGLGLMAFICCVLFFLKWFAVPIIHIKATVAAEYNFEVVWCFERESQRCSPRQRGRRGEGDSTRGRQLHLGDFIEKNIP